MSENLTLTNKNSRIQYIDALRGFTMILVVFAHVETFGFFNFSYETFLGKFFQSFRMPLFFFISGFIAYKAGRVWSRDVVWQLTKKKLRIQIIPALVIGLIYTCLYLRKDFHFFIADPSKAGYWFTLALLEMFLLYYFLSWGAYRIAKKFNTSDITISVCVLVAAATCLYLLKLPFKTIPVLDVIGNYSSCHYTFNYFLFFVFGVLARQFSDTFISIVENKYASAICVILFLLGFYGFYQLDNNIDQSDLFWKVALTIIETLVATLGVVVVYSYFRKYAESFDSTKRFGRILQFVGRRTLDIYLLHYFFLPHLPQIGDFLKMSNNVVVELLLGLGLSLLIIGVCLCISNVIRISPFLGKYLFGARE